MTNTVQSSDGVVLSFFKDDWVVFLCATDITISLSTDVLPIRTVGDGHWAKNTYHALNWTITISGVLKVNDFADANWTGLDMIDNQLNFNHIRARCTYIDDAGTEKSVEGYCMVQGVSLASSVGQLVKNDITLVGNGELQFFDGLIPCDSLITSITVTGQTAADGIVHFTYTYTGSPYQIKYRIDGVGAWVYALTGVTIDYPGLANGTHSIEMIPVCANGYEAEDSTSTSFIITHALTCSAVFDTIAITSTTATPHISAGTPATYKYRIDGGAWVYVAISFVVPLGGLSVGSHTIEAVPICSNGVEGTGDTESFSITSTPSQSIINLSIFSMALGNYLQLYVDGILVGAVDDTTTTNSFTVATGASIRGSLNAGNISGLNATLTTFDVTTATTIDVSSHAVPFVINYVFTANGDEFNIGASIL